MALRPLTQEELQDAAEHGYDISKYDGRPVDIQDAPKQQSTTALGVGARAAGVSAIPTLAGGAGFAGGMALGGALAPATGGLSLAIPLILGAAGAYGGSKLAAKSQEAVMPDSWKQQLATDVAEHPTASTVGSLATLPLGGMNPSKVGTIAAATGLGRKIMGLPISTIEKQALINSTVGATLGGVQEAVIAPLEGRDIDPRQLALNAAIGGMFTKPNTLGTKVFKFHDLPSRTVDNPELLQQIQNKERLDNATVVPSEDKAKDMSKPINDILAQIRVATGLESSKVTEGKDKFKLAKKAESSGKVMDELLKADAPITSRQDPDIIKTIDSIGKAIAAKQNKGSQEPDNKTPLTHEVESKLGEKGLTSYPSDEYVDAVTREVLNQQNIKVSSDNKLADSTGKPLKGQALLPNDIREVVYNPANSTIDTLPHEGLHYFRTELEQAAANGDRKATELLNKWNTVSVNGLEAYNKQRAVENKAPVDAHEFAVSEQGLEFVKQQFNLLGETGKQKWWNDTKALFKEKWSKDATLDDLRRAVNFRFVNEQTRGQFVGKEGPLGAVGNASSTAPITENRNQESDYSPEELTRYKELVSIMKSKPTTEAWQELETLKNKYGGKVPQTELFDVNKIKASSEFAKMREAASGDKERIAEADKKNYDNATRNQDLDEGLTRDIIRIAKTTEPYKNWMVKKMTAREPISDELFLEALNKDKALQEEVMTEPDIVELLHVASLEKDTKLKQNLVKEEVAKVKAEPIDAPKIEQSKSSQMSVDAQARHDAKMELYRQTAKDVVLDKELGTVQKNKLNLSEVITSRMDDYTAQRIAQQNKESGKELPKRVAYQEQQNRPPEKGGRHQPEGEGLTLEKLSSIVEKDVREKFETEAANLLKETKKYLSAKGHKEIETASDNDVFKIYESEEARNHLKTILGDLDGNRLIEMADDLEEKLQGLPKQISDLEWQMRPKVDHSRNQPADEGLNKEKYGFFRPLEGTFDKVKRVSPELGKAGDRFEARKGEYLALRDTALSDLDKFDRQLVNKVQEARRAAYRDDKAFNPTGKDKAINDVLSYYDKIGKLRADSGLLIDERRPGQNNTYVPDQLNDKTLHLFTTNPAGPEAKYFVNKWVKYVVDKSASSEHPITEQEARSNITAYIGALGGEKFNYLSAEFGAIRKAAGYGLPDEIREHDAMRNLEKYGRRAATDLAMYQELESKPDIANMLKLRNPNTGKFHEGHSEENLIHADARVRDMMKWVTGAWGGTISQSAPKVNALMRTVNNALLGTVTGIRNVVQMPVNALPYIHSFSDLGAAWKGLLKTRENSRASLEAGARQPQIDKLQFNELMEAPDRFSAIVRKVATALRKYQGAEAIENISRDITFSVGKELTLNNIRGAKAGDKQSARWLDRFGLLVDEDITTLTGIKLEKAINQTAKNFVDANQGTYGGRGLPAGIMDSQFAPFFSLQKWSVEKSNVIYKDVVKPFLDGSNRLPMLTYTLGTFLTGVAIQQLNELLTNKKSNDPNINEALAKGDVKSIISELVTLMQLSSYGGIIGDGLKFITDTALHGKAPRNIVSFPTATAAINLEEKTTDMLEAIRQGENPWDVFKMYALDLMTTQIQAARLIANHTVNEKDVEKTDKFRDVRVFNELEGKPAKDFGKSNQYLGLEEKNFKRSSDLGEAVEALPLMVRRQMEKSGGDSEKLKRGLQSLKGNSYQTFPDMQRTPMSFQRYYEYLAKTQGQSVADARLADYMKQTQVNKIKSSLVPSF